MTASRGRPLFVLIVELLLALGLLASCAKKTGIVASGTIELDEVDVSSMIGGRVARLHVEAGDSVMAGDTLAVLDRGEITAGLEAQAAQAARANAQWRDLASGPRAPEILAARAALASANSQAELTEAEYKRMQTLFEGHVVAQADLERAKAARDVAVAGRESAREQVRLLETGFRRNQVAAAQRGVEVARAELLASRSRAGELVLTAPTRGVVLLRNFDEGEVAAPGQSIVTLGDPERLWIRVFVAAPDLPRVRLGATAQVTVHGMKQSFPGRITEIASRAEFTPRAALTEDERANLVFGVKIMLEPTGGVLKPGLPADAAITPATADAPAAAR